MSSICPIFGDCNYQIDEHGLEMCAGKRVGLAHNLMYEFKNTFKGRKSIQEKHEILDDVAERVFTSDRVQWELQFNKASMLPLIIETLQSFKTAESTFGVKGEEYEDKDNVRYYYDEVKYWINRYLKEENVYQYL